MFKSLSILSAFALLFLAVPAEAATYHNAVQIDQKLSITKRLNDGTMLPRVRDIQTITINGKKYTSEPAVDKNMTHLRNLSVCSVTPVRCKSVNTTWQN